MAQTSEELKREIGQTREQIAETTDALAYKADVPTRTKDGLARRRARSSRQSAASPPRSATRRPTGRMSLAARSHEALCGAKSGGLAIGGAAVGFLAGLLAPSTRIEDERIGPMADDVKASAVEAGREAVESAGRTSCRKRAARRSTPRRSAAASRARSSRRACRTRHVTSHPPAPPLRPLRRASGRNRVGRGCSPSSGHLALPPGLGGRAPG